MPTKNSSPPSPQELGDRIVRNLDQVRGYLNLLQKEITDPAKSTGGGSRSKWQSHTEKLDDSLVELRRILTKRDEEMHA